MLRRREFGALCLLGGLGTRNNLSAQDVPASPPANLQLFLLIGQSNMAGRGVVEPQDQEPIPGVWALNRNYEWAPAIDPIHFDSPSAGVGPGRSFARFLLRENPKASIGLIPAAVGGTSLDEWGPTLEFYWNAVGRVHAAGVSGALRGILWHQGERDADNDVLAHSYKDRFLNLIETMRAELSAWDVPVIVGELGEFDYTSQSWGHPHAFAVNEQLALTPLQLPRSAFVSSAGLTNKAGEDHFDSPSARELGRRYALAYLSLDPAWSAAAPGP